MSGSLMIHATLAQFTTGETIFVVTALGAAAGAYVWRRAGYLRHLHRVAEIERRIALRSAEQALA